MTRVVVLTPGELRELVRAAVDEALRGPRPQRARRAPVAPTGAPPPADPTVDRELEEQLRQRGLA